MTLDQLPAILRVAHKLAVVPPGLFVECNVEAGIDPLEAGGVLAGAQPASGLVKVRADRGEILGLDGEQLEMRRGTDVPQPCGYGTDAVEVEPQQWQGDEPKSRRPRTVPLAQQAKDVVLRLRSRGRFTGRNDLVFCREDGGPLDRSAVRKRFIRAQKKANVRMRRFHDLRHTFGSLAIRRFDLVSVKDMMGHSKLTTTERYLHSRPRPTDAVKLTAIFAEKGSADLTLVA